MNVLFKFGNLGSWHSWSDQCSVFGRKLNLNLATKTSHTTRIMIWFDNCSLCHRRHQSFSLHSTCCWTSWLIADLLISLITGCLIINSQIVAEKVFFFFFFVPTELKYSVHSPTTAPQWCGLLFWNLRAERNYEIFESRNLQQYQLSKVDGVGF